MKIICGGQSGVDRAALDVAIARGIEYGGWCPKGGWAEDYPTSPGLLSSYPRLRETPLADPAQRTEWNVRDADACLTLLDGQGLQISNGTNLATALAERYRKPNILIDLDAPSAAELAAAWLRAQRETLGSRFTLAIGGPRESEAPGIYAKATAFLGTILSRQH